MGAAQPNEPNGGLGGRVATPARLVSPLAPSNKSLAPDELADPHGHRLFGTPGQSSKK